MNIENNKDLTLHNTLRVSAKAKHFITVQSSKDVQEFVQSRYAKLPIVILGGGSNIIFTKDINGVAIRYTGITIQIIEETINETVIAVEAGVVWDDLVAWAVNRELSGIENLAFIPGCVGAAPVQNIAAYGQSVSETIRSVQTIDLSNGNKHQFTSAECEFGYRTSVFKKVKKPLLIYSVTFALSKTNQGNTDYYSLGARRDSVKKELSAIKPPPYSPKDIAKAVTSIRRRKLLDPKNDPTIGSFFINPTISRDDYQRLSKQVPDLQAYPAEQLKYTDSSSDSSAYVKIPAGRLLDVLGWKGRCIGNVCMSSKWASIVTHNGQASGKEVFEYLMQVKKDVKDTYQIELAYEAVVI